MFRIINRILDKKLKEADIKLENAKLEREILKKKLADLKNPYIFSCKSGTTGKIDSGNLPA